jgi:hypothetical protein
MLRPLTLYIVHVVEKSGKSLIGDIRTGKVLRTADVDD